MNILGIDSSGLVATVALLRDDILVAEYTIHNKKTHSQTLLPMIDTMMNMAEISIRDVDAIAVAAGPGSFTGLRIGASSAKGLAAGLNVPIVSVPTLEGLAYNVSEFDGVICPLMDARRNQAYYGIFKMKDGIPCSVEEQSAGPIEDVVDKINNIGEKVIFLGDGVPVFKDFLEEKIEVLYEFSNPSTNYQRASSVATLGKKYYEQGKYMEAKEFVPVYLRVSQAERERAEREKAK